MLVRNSSICDCLKHSNIGATWYKALASVDLINNLFKITNLNLHLSIKLRIVPLYSLGLYNIPKITEVFHRPATIKLDVNILISLLLISCLNSSLLSVCSLFVKHSRILDLYLESSNIIMLVIVGRLALSVVKV